MDEYSTTPNHLTPTKPKAREFWIFKGTSKFCDEMEWDFDIERKHKPEGFYDLVSPADTIVGGIHVIEASALKEANELLDLAMAALEKFANHIPHKNASVVEKCINEAYAKEARTAIQTIKQRRGL